jgi:ATP-dependent Clp protease adaptor protein ClpS
MSTGTTPAVEPKSDAAVKLLPPYHVLIENDDHHSQDFVVMVLRKVFGYDEPKATQLMHAAEEMGEAVVWTGPKEVAELKLDQIRTCHEHRVLDSNYAASIDLGPVGCRIEPAS